MMLVLIAVIVVGVAAVALAVLAPKARERERVKREGAPLQATTAWTNEAGDEFAGLSESARCDLIFAVGALEDERSQHLLEHALTDPAEAVSLAAAHVLATSGRRNLVEAFLAQHPGVRADRISQTLSLLDSAPAE